MKILTLLNQIKNNPTQVLECNRLELFVGDEIITQDNLKQMGYKITVIEKIDDKTDTLIGL